MPVLAPLLLAPLLLALTMTPAAAETLTGRDWQLLAIDGAIFDAAATLRIEEDGGLSGQAPCNRWFARNQSALPALDLAGIGATRMACDQLAEEQVFFDALAAMTALAMDGGGTLILTGADGRSMEFVHDRMHSLTTCTTCPPQD
jgi:heat shock protein HslJ